MTPPSIGFTEIINMTFKAAQALVQFVVARNIKKGGRELAKKSYCSICFSYHTCNPFTLASQHIAIPQFSMFNKKMDNPHLVVWTIPLCIGQKALKAY